MATKEVAVDVTLKIKPFIDAALRNINGIFSLDAKEVDRPRIKLAIWMIRVAFWIGRIGEVEFEYKGEHYE